MLLVIGVLGLFSVPSASGQVNGDFQSVASGNWNTLAVWQWYTNGMWVPAPYTPTSADVGVELQTGTSVTNTGSISIDRVKVDAGAMLVDSPGNILTIAHATGSTNDLDIFGTLLLNTDTNGDFVLASNAAVVVENGGVYEQFGTVPAPIQENPGSAITFLPGSQYQDLKDTAAIPIATWSPGSTCLINNIAPGTNGPNQGGLNQVFYNFVWTNFFQSGVANMQPFPAAGFNGNLIFATANGQGVTNFNASSGTLNVGGNFAVTNCAVAFNPGTLNVTGNVSIASSGAIGASGSPFNFNFAGANPQSLMLSGTVNNPADFAWTVSSNSTVTLNTGLAVPSPAAFTDNGTLFPGTNVINGSGTFTVGTGATLGIGSTGGISSGGSTGNIQTGTRNFSTHANYLYNGTAAQSAGNGLPSSMNNLTDANTNGAVSLGGVVAVNTNLTVNSGATLNLNGNNFSTAGLVGAGAINNSSTTPVTLTVGNNNVSSVFSGTIEDTGASASMNLHKIGFGTLVLNGASTYGGTTTIGQGTVQVGNVAALGSTSSSLFLGAVTLDLATDTSVDPYTTTLNTAQSTTLILSDKATPGSPGINHTLGALTLNGAASQQLDIAAGTNVSGGSPSVTFGTTTLVQPSPVFDVASGVNLTLGSLVGNFNLTKQDGGQLTLAAAANSLRVNAIVTLTGGTLKMGGVVGSQDSIGTAGVSLAVNTNSTLDLATDASTLAHNVTVNGPVTFLSDKATAGSAGITHTLGTLNLNGSMLSVAAGTNVTGGIGGLAFGATTLSVASIFDVATNASLALGTLNGNVAFSKQDAGTMVLTNTSPRSSGTVTLNSGVLKLGNSGALGSASVPLVLNGGLLDIAIGSSLNGYNTTLGGNATILSDLAVSGAGTTYTLGPLIFGADTLTVSPGSNVTSGVAGLNFGGTLLSGPAALNVTAGANVTFGSIANGTNSFTIVGAGNASVSGTFGNGAGGLTMNGTGTLTLNGTCAYTGPTMINAGKIVEFVMGNSVASSAITVGGGAILDVEANTPGLQWSAAGTVTLNSSSELDLDFGNLVPSASTPPLNLAGTLAVNATTIIRIKGTSGNFQTGQTFPLIQFGAGPADATGFSLILPPRLTGHLTVASGVLNLVIDSSGEPLSWAVGNAFWDTSTTNWNDANGAPTRYIDGNDAVSFNDSATGGSPITVTLNSVFSPASVTSDNTAKNYTLSGSGALAGGGGLTNNGGGTLVLNLSGGNSYAGDTAVNAGTLQLGANNQVPNGAGKGNLDVNGTLDLHGFSETANGLSGAGIVDTTSGGAATLTIGNNNANGAFSGVIQNTAGTLSLVKTGGGTVVLAGANTYGGTTTVAQGTLQVDNGSATGSLSPGTMVAVVNGATLAYDRPDGMTVSNTLAGAGTIAQIGSGVLTLAGTGTNTVSATVTNGTLNLGKSGANACGSLLINGGVVRLTGTGGDQIANSASVTISSGTLDLNGNSETVVALNGFSGLATIANGASNTTATLTGSGDFDPSQEFRFDVAAGGTLIIPSSYSVAGTGPLHIYSGAGGADTGTTVLLGPNSINMPILIDNGATLQLGDGNADGIMSGNPGSITNNGTLAYNSSLGLQLTPAIAGSGVLVKSGTGTLTLLGTNSNTGGTSIHQGALQIGNNGTVGALGSGNVTNNGSLIFDRADSVAISSPISGSGPLIQAGNGILTLADYGVNSYTGGTVVSNGTLRLVSSPVTPDRDWVADSLSASNGTAIGTWTDIIAGRNATNFTASQQPLLITDQLNGHSVLRFNQTSNDFLTVAAADSPTSNATNFTVVSVFDTTTPGTAGAKFWTNTPLISTAQPYNPTYDWALCLNTNQLGAGFGAASLAPTCRGSVDLSIYGGNAIDGSPHVAVYVCTGTNFILYEDGVVVNSLVQQGELSNGPTNICPPMARYAIDVTIASDSTFTNCFNGDMAEIQLYGRDLSPVEVGTLTANLIHKYVGTPIGTAVNVAATSAVLDLNNQNVAINSLAGVVGSAVTLGAATLTVGDNTSTVYAGGITGSGGLTKVGSGTLRLDRTNSYTGPVTISSGTLALGTNGICSGTQLINVGSGAVFNVSSNTNFALGSGQAISGGGVVLGNVLAGANSAIEPGGIGAVGTLTFSNNLTLATNALLNFDLNAGGSNDLLVVAGNLAANSNTLVLAINGTLNPGTYPLITYSGMKTGHFNPVPQFTLASPPAVISEATPNEITLVVTNTTVGGGSATNNIVGVVNNGNGTFDLMFMGVPGQQYFVETTTNLTIPITWQVLTNSTNTAAAGNGSWSYTATNGAGQQYYRSGAVTP